MEFSRTLPRHTVDELLYLLNIKGKANQEITKEGGARPLLTERGQSDPAQDAWGSARVEVCMRAKAGKLAAGKAGGSTRF